MMLKTYLKASHGRGKRLAKSCGRSQTWVSQLASGDRQPTPLLMAVIERVTGGEVPFESWRPPAADIDAFLSRVRPSGGDVCGAAVTALSATHRDALAERGSDKHALSATHRDALAERGPDKHILSATHREGLAESGVNQK